MPYAAPPPVAAVAAHAAGRCALTRLSACGDTNQLVLSPGFRSAVTRFVGRGPEAVDALNALGGPPDDPVEVGPGLSRFSACVAHDCPDKGAAFITSDGRLQAIGLLNLNVPLNGGAQTYSLKVIAPPAQAARFTALATSWAQPADDADAKDYGGPEPRIVLTTFHAAAAR